MYREKQKIFALIREELGFFENIEQSVLFFGRLGREFDVLYENFIRLYGDQEGAQEIFFKLLGVLRDFFLSRKEELKELDKEREKNVQWFFDQKWIGYVLYVDRYAQNLSQLTEKIPYWKELGVNVIHLMPLMKSPNGENDGGYAVSDYTQVDPKYGKNEDLLEFISLLHQEGMAIVLDFVLNHTSSEHEWASKAREGNVYYQQFYYMFDEIPKEYDDYLVEIFPETAPGNFTYVDSIQKYVMTLFHSYQWDLNYRNPRVFLEMTKILLELCNWGVDFLRLDAVPYLWKKPWRNSQNEPETHLLLQLWKSAARIVAPSTVYIAEAIMQPQEIVKYFGEGHMVGRECDLAYNANFMVLLWDSLATQNTKLLQKSIELYPDFSQGGVWLNYIRSHDDIGWSFSDQAASSVGYNPFYHRQFLISFYTGEFPNSWAKGLRFMFNPKTQDARISGTCASLCGLESAKKERDVLLAIKRIKMLIGVILSSRGLPLIYYGDELGYCNQYEGVVLDGDNRWIHRPLFDWKKAEKRKEEGAIEHELFHYYQRLIQLRKQIPLFSSFVEQEWLPCDEIALLAYRRRKNDDMILVLGNVSMDEVKIPLSFFQKIGLNMPLYDIISGNSYREIGEFLLGPYDLLWLKEGEK